MEEGIMNRTIAAALCCLLLSACASREDRQWHDLQTILEIERAR
jgi:hypothetical protein